MAASRLHGAAICRDRGWEAGRLIRRDDPDTGGAIVYRIAHVGHYEAFGVRVDPATGVEGRAETIRRLGEFRAAGPGEVTP